MILGKTFTEPSSYRLGLATGKLLLFLVNHSYIYEEDA